MNLLIFFVDHSKLNAVYQTYQQRLGGVRVFGGDFKVTLSAAATNQLVVLNAHGSPLTEDALDANFNDIDVSRVLQTAMPPMSSDIRRTIQTYLTTSRVNVEETDAVDVGDIELSATKPVELVWYPMHSTTTTSTSTSEVSAEVSLAYYVKGSVTTTDRFVSFYAFVDVNSGKVLNLVQLNDEEHLDLTDKTSSSSGAAAAAADTYSTSKSMKSDSESDKSVSAVPPSPFASPISDASIYCYDQYLKDYNDGE